MDQHISLQKLEQLREGSFHGAEIRKRNGHRDWWEPYIFAALEDLQIAVCFNQGISNAVQYLHSRKMAHFLDELAAYHEVDRDERISQGLPVGNDLIRYCLFACTCWLMEADQVAQRWIELGLHPAARVMLSRFDFAYMDAHVAFMKKTPYILPEAKKWRRWEIHLLRYAALAAAITRNEDIGPYVAEVKKHFDHRNRTYRLTENYDLLDGCKLCPASFDIRLEGILSFARRHYSINTPQEKNTNG